MSGAAKRDASASEVVPEGIRITAIIGSLNRGGCERHLLNVLPKLNASRFRAEVFVLLERGELADAMESGGIRVYQPRLSAAGSRSAFVRILSLACSSFQLWLHLLLKRPDIVHFFLPTSYLIGAPAAIMSGIRRRVMSRRSLNNYQRAYPVSAMCERVLHRTTGAFVANSLAVARQLVESERVSWSKTTIIYNGVSIPDRVMSEIREIARASLDISSDAFVMVMVANLISYKGHDFLLRGCALAREHMPRNWVLLLVGRDDGISTSLRKLSRELGIENFVRFLGERGDVETTLQAADLGLLVSRQEGFSNAILECMASGLPMLVTDVGGNSEAVVDGVTGRVIPADDETALSEGIAYFAEDPQRRQKMGASGRERAASHFDVSRCVKNYEEFYASIAARNFVGGVSSDLRSR